jgi:hypothetical protein
MPLLSVGFTEAMAYWVSVLQNPDAPARQKDLAAREIGKLELSRKRNRKPRKAKEVPAEIVPVATPVVNNTVQAMLERAKN